jgi:hypothetical protein
LSGTGPQFCGIFRSKVRNFFPKESNGFTLAMSPRKTIDIHHALEGEIQGVLPVRKSRVRIGSMLQ